LEFLASRQLTAKGTSPILCLVGPPGTGKTSIGRSIAEALNKKYIRLSLGGVRDEAEIRGHRRTYVGAMPGRIATGLRKSGVRNPLMMLDEVDKLSSDYKGDTASALLEVLDSEQNSHFEDHYIEIPIDLSDVLFIATANTLDTIPRPLLDRMELIEMTGYLREEKQEIAKRHLIPKQLADHALSHTQLKFPKAILEQIISDYTRESGVRSLNRQIATICSKVDARIAMDEPYNQTLTREDVIDYLGQPRYTNETYETNRYIGVVTGLAWTQVGGEILFIETSLSPAKTPTLTITGNLGDVMKESATIALGYIKAHAAQFGIRPKDLETQSVHIHVPEGAIPKDGPSAGITMTTALVSAFTKRKVRARIAMTGEMTLRGKVLPIGGVKEKILAAKRAGITDLVLCEENRKDVTAIPEKYLSGLRFHYVKDIQEVIDFALLKH
jgi:ATP-dependent Lon protease